MCENQAFQTASVQLAGVVLIQMELVFIIAIGQWHVTICLKCALHYIE